MTNKKNLRILGIRGIPAAHGGFETFAERLALYLVAKGWSVTVYCQERGAGSIYEDSWQGARRVHIPVSKDGAAGTVVFDWLSVRHAAKESGLALTLGYNTAIFCALLRVKGHRNLINMDGIEWKRAKWSALERAWLFINERLGCWLGNHLIADHPAIAQHLATRVNASKITMIPYGADPVKAADPGLLKLYGLEPGSFALVVARPEPENSILEIVSAFSAKPRGIKLALLGRYDAANDYHRRVMAAASDEVLFLGPIYEKARVEALRFYTRLYVHGHQVGGTNPSLVEALGAGSPVLAHDNPYNRWVAGQGAHYFRDEAECVVCFAHLLEDRTALALMSDASRTRHQEAFTWPIVLEKYEHLLARWI